MSQFMTAALIALCCVSGFAQSANAKPTVLQPTDRRCEPHNRFYGSDAFHMRKPDQIPAQALPAIQLAYQDLFRYLSRIVRLIENDPTPQVSNYGACFAVVNGGESNAFALGLSGIAISHQLYFDIALKIERDLAPLALYLTVAHEFGHVIQSLVVGASTQLETRPMELQADCLAGLIGALTLDDASFAKVIPVKRALGITFSDPADPSAATDHGTLEERLGATQAGIDEAAGFLLGRSSGATVTVAQLFDACQKRYPL